MGFLNEPFVTTVLTLLFGGFLFNWITARRTRKNKIRDKTIEFLEEVGDDLNSAISLIYGRIRTKNFVIKDDCPIEAKRRKLLTKRFSVRIRSRAYLKSDEFWQKYEHLTFEVDRIISEIKSLPKDYDKNKALADQLKDKKKRLEQDWPLDERTFTSKYDSPAKELEEWTHMVWNRAVWLLTINLQVVLK